ncbi:MAG TPA: hypothetical protein VLV54_05985 [Thermoanaerobaculia bacterium]|nr:hypothetical protein [Thermoanaerobaculia bacterium]
MNVSNGGSRLLCWLALGLFLTYFFTSSGGFEVSDTSMRYLTAKSWLEGRGGALPAEMAWSGGPVAQDGRVFCIYGPVQAVLMVPFLVVVRAMRAGHVDRSVLETFVISLGLFPLISTLAMVLLFLALRGLGYSPRIALLATLGIALGSLFWHYARMGQEENLVALAYALWLYGVARLTNGGRFAASLMAGGATLALATRWATAPALAVLLALSLYFFHRYRRNLAVADLAFGASIVSTGILLLLEWNHYRFGSWLETGYGLWNAHLHQHMFLTDGYGDHLAALLVSPYRGVLFYSPILVAAIVGVFAARRGSNSSTPRLLGLGALAVLGVTLLMLGGFRYWAGGFSWGPRFFAGLHVLFAPALASLFARWPRTALLVPVCAVLQLFSTMLPASTEEYSRYNMEQVHPGACSDWTPQCTAVAQRIPRALAAVAHTVTGDGGIVVSGRPLVAPDVVLQTSDYRTLYWWPVRASFRMGALPHWAALLLCAAGLSGAAFCLRRAWRAT